MGIKGTYTLTLTRKGSAEHFQFHNLITNEGMALMLHAATDGVTTSPIWYMGLKGPGDPVITDTAAAHPGWQEAGGYSNNTRLPVTVTTQGLEGQTSHVLFLINQPVTVAGAFLSSSPAKGGTQGVLFSVGDFPAARVLYPGDRLELSYTFGLRR